MSEVAPIDVVLDTNVLVAALLKPGGDHSSALERIFDNPQIFRLAISSQTFAEYEDVLGRSIISARGCGEEARALLELVKDAAVELVPKFIPALVYPDAKDKPFLELVDYCNGVLVTNNLRDFPFAGKFRILRAGEFLRYCKHLGL